MLGSMTVELQWIDVREKLPESPHYPVLTAAKTPLAGVHTYQTAWYSRMRCEWYAYPSDKNLTLEVTHWMNIDPIIDPSQVEGVAHITACDVRKDLK